MLSCSKFPRRLKSLLSLLLIYTLTVFFIPGCGPERDNTPLDPRQDDGSKGPDLGAAVPLPVPTPPSVAAQEDFILRLLNDTGYVEGDEDIANYFVSAYYAPLSQTSKDVLGLWFTEWQANGMALPEFDERWNEFAVPLTPEWAALEAEMVPLWDFTVIEPGKFIGALIAVVVATVAAMFNANACQEDALDNQIACFEQQCPPGKQADIECCTDEAEEDIWNCFKSGGTNTPDPEYNSNCCKSKVKRSTQLQNH